MIWIKLKRTIGLRQTFAVLLLLSMLLLWGPASWVSAADSYDSLVAEIHAANSGGSGAISLSGDITISAPLPAITGRVTIDGSGHTISGDDAHRIFDVNGGALTLSNVSLTKGNVSEGRGGAILLRNGARVTIENSTLSHNRAKDGGAIYVNGGTIRVVNSIFENNCAESVSVMLNSSGQGADRETRSVDAEGCVHVTYHHSSMGGDIENGDGGAILLLNGAQASIEGSAFSENRATYGGAIAASSGNVKLTISGSSFDSNSVSIGGGAISADRGTTSISTSSFARNAAYSGGGAIRVGAGALDIFNSTFSENQTRSGAGALAIDGDATVTLTHLTFIDNWSLYWDSGAIENQGNGKVTLRNSIVKSRGGAEDCVGGLDQNIGNLSPDGTCAVRSSSIPLLGELSGSPAYYPLLDQSPAIDAAEAEYCLPSDQIGTPRPQSGGCDIGAIEATTAQAAAAPIVPPPACTLADQIIAANTDRAVAGCRAGSGAGTIRLTRDILLFSRLPAIKSFITIEGNGHTISGNKKFRIFDVDGGQLTVNNLTMTEGRGGSQAGDAIRLQNGGRAVVNDSSFINNSADVGGAIGIHRTASAQAALTVKDSTFLKNWSARTGGAIDANTGGATITGSSFIENSAGQSGGAISLLNYPRFDISNSSFINNNASLGGGDLGVENGANATLTHVTIYNHGVVAGSTSIHNFYTGYGARSRVRLRNSVISGSRHRTHCGGDLAQSVGNIVHGGACSAMLSDDPLLEEATDAATVLAPLPGSPAIGAADPRFCLETDQLGRRRLIVGGCDIGAIESVPVSHSVSDCVVTTTHTLNFRDGPSGDIIGGVPQNATLSVKARTPRWFEVEHEGATGWISADYVVAEGECG